MSDIRKFCGHLLLALIALLVLMACVLAVLDTPNSVAIPDEPVAEIAERVSGDTFDAERSSKWRAVRNAYILEHPVCEACGTDRELNVHHVKPFHLYPELELDMDNLITLCREHHFRIGHDPDGIDGPRPANWKSSNPDVRQQSAEYRLGL